MAFLKLNGIVVPVHIEGAGIGRERIGESERSQNASLVTNLQAVKGEWPFSVVHADGETALAWQKLIEGEGDVWDFEAGDPQGLYSSQGTPLFPSDPSVEVVGTGQKYGSKCLFVAGGQYAQADGILGDAWSLHVWGWVGSGQQHLFVRSDGAKWVDGVRNDALDVSTWLLTTGGNLRLLADGFDGSYDDLVVLPYLVPDDWPPQLFAAGAAFGNLQHHVASGDFIEAGTRSVTVEGAVEGLDPVRAAEEVVFVVRAKLREV